MVGGLERIDNKYLVGWLVHVCVQLAEILPRHPHLWCYFVLAVPAHRNTSSLYFVSQEFDLDGFQATKRPS